MISAAKRGLRLYADGEAGDGLQESTVRDARAMADGKVSEPKWRKIGAWIARHIDDLDAVDAETPITPGLVAHLLWGSGPTKSDALRAQRYAEGVVERLNAERNIKVTYMSRVEELEMMRTPSTEVETRRLTVQDFEIREGEQGSMSFRGYAAVFNSDSEPLPFTERILPGAFDKTLRSRNNIKMYLNHDSTLVLGSTRSKTLRLSVDGKGLLVDADLPDTSYARDLAVLMERGDVDSMSFGFSVPSGGDRWSPDGMTRELKQIRLHEVSVVTGFPAYQATSAALRSLAGDVDAETLSQALTTLENGEPLSGRHADLLESIINQLRDGDTQDEQNLIALKRKQIELLLNKF
jgi:HK97 family phage prohead protease